jgi:hypothetical protein
MRALLVVVMALLASLPARSQSAPQPSPSGQSAQMPVDHGPDTPAANNAYQGGGVILQGAPGAPAPRVEATPPGQKPKNALPLPPPG